MEELLKKVIIPVVVVLAYVAVFIGPPTEIVQLKAQYGEGVYALVMRANPEVEYGSYTFNCLVDETITENGLRGRLDSIKVGQVVRVAKLK